MALAIKEIVKASFVAMYENRTVLIFAIIGSLVSAALAASLASQAVALSNLPSFIQSLGSALPTLLSFIAAATIGALFVFLVKIFVIGAIISAVSLGARAELNASIDRATRRYLNLLATLIVMGILVFIGTILLVLPGLYIGLKLSIAPMENVLGGKGVMESLKSSWKATSGNLWNIFVILLLITIITAVISAVFSLFGPAVSGFVGSFVSFAFIVAGTLIYQRLTPAGTRARRRTKK